MIRRAAPAQHSIRRATVGFAAAVIAVALAACAGPAPEPTSPAPTASVLPVPKPSPSESAPPAFDFSAHSIDDPASIWVVSNKTRPLNPVDFVPPDLSMPDPAIVSNEFAQPLREPAARAVEALVSAAAAEGITIRVVSAYRDYATQQVLWQGYADRDGAAAADTYSARPGHSEHQTGLAVDFDDFGACYLQQCFETTAAGQWLAAHAAEYGFVLRYPNGGEGTTGFIYEPWHFRYIGVDAALHMVATGVPTLEEFFGLPAAPGYLS